mgnify:CR=1 FL=1
MRIERIRRLLQPAATGWQWSLPLLAVVLLVSLPRVTVAADALTVDATNGQVKIRFDGLWQTPDTGMQVALPAVVSTGNDGAIRLRQGDTVIDVAARSAIELYADADSAELVQRVVQEAGSAFYDIAPQGKDRFRVETPYLVAVVKGTQFNVTFVDETSTVALYEGLLRIDAPDIGESRHIVAGQIGRRHRDDPHITVTDMATAAIVPSEGGGTTTSGRGGDGNGGGSGDSGAGEGHSDDAVVVSVGVDTGDDGIATVDAGVDVGGLGSGVSLGLNDGVLGGDVGTTLDAGRVTTGSAVSAGVDLSDGSVDVGLDAGADVGDVSVDAGLDAGVDLSDGSVDLGLDAGADVGDVSVDAGLDAGVDLSGGNIDLGLDTGADIGDVTVDTGLDAGVDLSGGDIDLGLDTGGDVGDIVADVGLDVGIDLDDGAGLDVGADGLDVGVDLDLDPDTDGGIIDLDLGLDADTGGDTADPDGGADEGGLRGLLGL